METVVVRATSYLNARLTTMCPTVNEDSSYLYKILQLGTAQTYLRTGKSLLHRSTPKCNILQFCETPKNFQKRP